MTPLRSAAALVALVALTALAACVAPRTATRPEPTPPPRAATPPAPPVSPDMAVTGNAVATGIAAGPAIEGLPIDPTRARSALDAFRSSCRSLLARDDPSGMTRAADWRPACAAAEGSPGDPRTFFARWFETVRVGDGALHATGYYEPEIAGSATAAPGRAVPIYALPDDLVEADLGRFAADLKGRKVRGRVERGRLLPYPDRAAIEDRGLGGHARVLGYAADRVALFFLQVQGSGRVRLADGGVLRIGYAGQNGLPYTGIGKWMLAQGMLRPGEATMQGIVGWLHAHPDQADAVMRQNRSYVFFRILDGPPLGAMGVPVAARVTVAADPRFVPLGAPVWLAPDRPEAAGLWVAQDTGGAIKGANRLDTFWGAGDEAARIAGGMSTRGQALVLVPRGTLARLGADGGGPARP